MPKWWATSWMTVARISSMISSFDSHMDSIDPWKMVIRSGEDREIVGPLREGHSLVQAEEELRVVHEVPGKLIGRRPVLDDDVDILKASPEVLRYHAQGHPPPAARMSAAPWGNSTRLAGRARYSLSLLNTFSAIAHCDILRPCLGRETIFATR